MNRRFVRALSRTVDNAVLLALLVILFIATYALYDTTRVNEEADPAKYSTYKPTTEEGQKSFEELRAMNPDVMGWLTIYGIYYDGQNHGVELFAILTIDAYNPIVHATNLTTNEQKQQFLDRINTDKLLFRDMDINMDDHLVTMTTCNLTETNGRFTLIGKILDHEVPNPFPEEERTGTTANIDLYNMFQRVLKLTVWQWILLLVALILVIWCLYRLEKWRLANRQKKKEMKRD